MCCVLKYLSPSLPLQCKTEISSPFPSNMPVTVIVTSESMGTVATEPVTSPGDPVESLPVEPQVTSVRAVIAVAGVTATDRRRNADRRRHFRIVSGVRGGAAEIDEGRSRASLNRYEFPIRFIFHHIFHIFW